MEACDKPSVQRTAEAEACSGLPAIWAIPVPVAGEGEGCDHPRTSSVQTPTGSVDGNELLIWVANRKLHKRIEQVQIREMKGA